jgi:hypothetical protein
VAPAHERASRRIDLAPGDPADDVAMKAMSGDERRWRALPMGLALLTVATLAPLLVWDAFPLLFPAGAHDVLAALPLALVALAFAVHQGFRRPTRIEFAKTVLLVLAFLFWGANQLWPEHPLATLFNDVAIVGFVVDVVLAVVPWPRTPRTLPPATPDPQSLSMRGE